MVFAAHDILTPDLGSFHGMVGGEKRIYVAEQSRAEGFAL